jgi:hypothetical protein
MSLSVMLLDVSCHWLSICWSRPGGVALLVLVLILLLMLVLPIRGLRTLYSGYVDTVDTMVSVW